MTDPDQVLRRTAWRQFRAAFLTRYPICAVLGCGRPAVVVDHKMRRSAGGAVFDPSNCEQLCYTHHNRKSRVHDQRHQPGEYEHRMHGSDASGIPLDTKHHWR